MEFRIISSKASVHQNDHSSGVRIIFFEDDGKSRCTILLRYSEAVRDLIRELENSLAAGGAAPEER